MSAGRLALAGLGCATVLALVLLAAGGAVATAGNATVSPTEVTSGANVTVAADADDAGADLTVAIDGDLDGTIQADEALGTVTTNGTTGDGNVSTALGSYVAGEGTYTVYVVEESSSDGGDDTSYPVANPSAFYEANTTVEVDDTAPGISDFAVTNPADRDVRVTLNASERLGDVEVVVEGDGGETLTEVDFVSTGSGPVTYEATHFPAIDGEYRLRLESAADPAGNEWTGEENATVVAAIERRDADTVFETPVDVFLGETDLDVSPVLGDGPVTLRPVDTSGTALPVSGNASSLDVTGANGIEPGGYDGTGDGTADLVVRSPRIDDLSVVLDTDEDDVDVGGAYLQSGDAITVTASFGFGAADDLQISVVDPAGVDVTPAITDEPVLNSPNDAVSLDTKRTDIQTGTYTIAASAETLEANATATVTLVEREVSITVDRTRVVRGRAVTATAFGPPGGRAVVRFPVAALSNESTPATTIFEDTGDVLNVTRSGRYVGVELALGRDGIAQTRFDTSSVAPGPTRVTVVDGPVVEFDAASADSVPLDVERWRVVVGDAPEAATVNEGITVSGSAPQLGAVKAYARVGDTWYPLGDTEWAKATVDPDGRFTLDIPVAGELAYPGVYQVAVVGLHEASSMDVGENETLAHGELASRPFETFTVETRVGG